MYAVPLLVQLVYEQLESALIERGSVMFPGSGVSIRSKESDDTLSPNQDGTFSYGLPSKPVGLDIVRLIKEQAANFGPG